MDYDITPHVGVGPLKLGMTRDDVRTTLGSEVTTFGESDGGMPIDAFNDLGVHAHYRPPGILEAIQLWGPASPTLDGQPLLKRPFREIRDWVRSQDPDVEIEDDGLTSKKLGIASYAPSAKKSPRTPPEGVFVFEPGYYEKYS